MCLFSNSKYAKKAIPMNVDVSDEDFSVLARWRCYVAIFIIILL